ncbi:MAG: helix-turn-helix transcriptional regulator [Myxococcales bacterium]|nr:helix-turn-helix transcriptional regulator [Myxococcales bacterium]
MKTLYLDQVRGIHEVFYRARHFPRKISLHKFAETLGSINAAQLGAVETGVRLPSEDLVRRLAEYLNVDADRLLLILRIDRILQRFVTELETVLIPPPVEPTPAVEPSARKRRGPKYRTYSDRNRTHLLALDLAVKRLISSFPLRDTDVSRESIVADLSREFDHATIDAALKLLMDKGNIVVGEKAGTLRQHSSHYLPQTADEKLAWATNFCATVIKGVIEACVQGSASGEGWAQDFFYYVDTDRVVEVKRAISKFLSEDLPKLPHIADAIKEHAEPGTSFVKIAVATNEHEPKG